MAHDVYQSEEITHAFAKFPIKSKLPQCIMKAASQLSLWLEAGSACLYLHRSLEHIQCSLLTLSMAYSFEDLEAFLFEHSVDKSV